MFRALCVVLLLCAFIGTVPITVRADANTTDQPMVLPEYFVSEQRYGCITHNNGDGSAGRDNMWIGQTCTPPANDFTKKHVWTINSVGMWKLFNNIIGDEQNKCVVVKKVEAGSNLYVVNDCSSVRGALKRWTYDTQRGKFGTIRLLSEPTLCVGRGPSDKFTDWRRDWGLVLQKCDEDDEEQLYKNTAVVPPSDWLPENVIPAPAPGDDDDDDDDNNGGGPPVLPDYFVSFGGAGGCIAHNGNGWGGRDNMFMEGCDPDLEELENDNLWTINDAGMLKPFTNMIGGQYNKCAVIPQVDNIEEGTNLYVVEECGSVKGNFKKWTYNTNNDGSIRLLSDPSFCVSKGTSDKFTDWRKEEGVVLRKCDGKKDQIFENVDAKPPAWWLPDVTPSIMNAGSDVKLGKGDKQMGTLKELETSSSATLVSAAHFVGLLATSMYLVQMIF